MHFAVALFWSTLFAMLVARSRVVRETLDSPGGAWKVAALYGPLIWTAMSFVVIAPLVGRPPRIDARWWVMLVGHVPSAGLPIALAFRNRRR
jgi:hypothetical protein